MTDIEWVEFNLQQLGVSWRPKTEEEVKKLKTVFETLPYEVFLELAKHGVRPKYRGCPHCVCQCVGCKHCGPTNEEEVERIYRGPR